MILIVADLYIRAFFLLLFINVFSMLKSLKVCVLQRVLPMYNQYSSRWQMGSWECNQTGSGSLLAAGCYSQLGPFHRMSHYCRSGLVQSHLVSSSCNSRSSLDVFSKNQSWKFLCKFVFLNFGVLINSCNGNIVAPCRCCWDYGQGIMSWAVHQKMVLLGCSSLRKTDEEYFRSITCFRPTEHLCSCSDT